MAKKTSPHGPEIEHFENLAARTRELFEQSVEKSRTSLEDALETVKKEMVAAGTFTAEKGEQLRKFVMRDLTLTQDELESAVRGASHGLNPERIGFGVLGLMQSLAESAGEVCGQECAGPAPAEPPGPCSPAGSHGRARGPRCEEERHE